MNFCLSKKSPVQAILLFLLCLLAPSNPLHAQNFGSVAIGGGGYVTGIISCPTRTNLFYARTDVGGAYRWDEPTQSWIPLSDWNSPSQLSYQGVESIALDPQSPNRLYLVVGTSYWNNGITAILCSTNYGTNFTVVDVTSLFKANGNGNDRNKGEELAVDPNLGSILFCGSRANGLFQSTNYGATWNAVSSFNGNLNLGTDSISFVKFAPQSSTSGNATRRIFVGVFRTGNNLFVSNDGGGTWSAVSGSPAAAVPERCELANNNLLYIAYGTGTNGCLMSYNVTNQAWGNCTPGGVAQTYGAISVCATNPNLMIASTFSVWKYQSQWGAYGDKIYVSTNAGAAWNDLYANNLINMDANGYNWIVGSAIGWAGSTLMDPFNPNRIFCPFGGGMFITTNLNSGASVATWKYTVKGLEETVPITFLSVPGGPLVSSLADVSGFVHTNILSVPYNKIPQASGFACATKLTNFIVQAVNGGGFNYSLGLPVAWTPFASTPPGLTNGTPAVSADGHTVLWDTTANGTNACYATTNLGVSWTACTGLTFRCQPQGDPVNPQKFYAYNSGDGYLYVSTDGGLTFASAGSAGTGGQARFALAPGLEGHIWIARNGNGLQYSTNSGATFYSAGVTEADAVSFGKASPSASYPTLFISGRPTSSSTVGLYRSTDQAANWLRVNDNLHQYGGLGNAGIIEGDKNVFGRVYLSTAGRGIPALDSSPTTNYYNQAILAYHPVNFYEFNELTDSSLGHQPAYDSASGFNGTYGSTAKNGFNGILGPIPPTLPGFLTNNSALQTKPGDANSLVTLPNLNLNTNTVTLMAWIKPNTLAPNRGIIYCRGNGTTAGLCLGSTGDNALGYNWNANGNATNWDSGLIPNLNEWALATLVISPSNAVIYLQSPTKGTLSATNPVANANQSFAYATTIGSDFYSAATRTWDGSIDEVAIFTTCLTAPQIQNLYAAGLGQFITPPSLPQPAASQTVYVGSTARLGITASGDALHYQWQAGPVGSGVYTNLPLGGRISVGSDGSLVISNALSTDQADYVVWVTNSMGSVVSLPATLTVVPTELAYRAVMGAGPVAFYEFNESGNPAGGGLVVQDSAASFNGTYGTTSQNGFNNYTGPRPPSYPGFWPTNSALKATANDANSFVTLPNLNLNTNTVTLAVWIKPATLANDRGIVYCRGNGTTAGICLGNHGDNALGYNWNDNGNAYNWDSGLIPNLNEWALVALVISPTNAVEYLLSPTKGVLAATNNVANPIQSFANSTTVGTDVYSSASRAWDGGLDDVSIYNYCLSRAQITSLFTAGSGVGAPTASFTLGPNTGVSSVLVNFTNTTTGTALSGTWNFGDGTTSTNLTPTRFTHTYTQSACLATTNLAVLSVTNSGWVSVFTNPNPIIVYPPAPTPTFAVGSPNAATNQTINFTNLTTSCATTWLWNFGDGSTSPQANPTHAYLAAGTYSVTLLATNAYGLGATSSAQTITVTNLPPPSYIKPVYVKITSVSLLQKTNVQLVGSNYPVTANAPFNVLWTSNLTSGGSLWLTNPNLLGDRVFNGNNGRFTNIVVNGASSTQAFLKIQVP